MSSGLICAHCKMMREGTTHHRSGGIPFSLDRYRYVPCERSDCVIAAQNRFATLKSEEEVSNG